MRTPSPSPARASDAAVTFDLTRFAEVGDCHEWTGPYHGRTPAAGWLPGRPHTLVTARRAVWLAAGRRVPAGCAVYAKCCNSRCVRLAHLACGPHGEHLRVMGAAGKLKHTPAARAALRAAALARSPYTDAQRARVRELRAQGLTFAAIAAALGMNASAAEDLMRKSHNAASVFTWRPGA